VSFSLEVAKNIKDTHKAVIESFEVITHLMLRYIQYKILFILPPINNEFENRITEVYKAILLYSMEIKKCLEQYVPDMFSYFEAPAFYFSKSKQVRVYSTSNQGSRGPYRFRQKEGYLLGRC
jgi:hypothetical protein